MKSEEWDWPPTRRRRFYRSIDYYPPRGWNAPVVRKAVDIYFRATLFIIKALIAIPLSIVGVAAFWMLWIIVTRFNY